MRPAGDDWVIEDPREHETAAVARLRELLARGARGRPDPKRRHFHEIADGGIVYWVHIAPGAKRALLLATWPAGREWSESECAERSPAHACA